MGPVSDNYARAFYEMLLISLILSFSPFKALGYLQAFICIGWFLVRSKSGDTFRRLVMVQLAWGALLLFYNCYSRQIGLDFNNSNAILSYMHYVAILLIPVIPAGVISGSFSYEKYARVLLWVIGLEGCLGILQRMLVFTFRAYTSGDVVEGTINPFSFITGHSGFGNQFYSINMVCLLLFCFPYAYYKRKAWLASFLAGFLALVLASVGHVFYSLMLAILVTYLLFAGWTLLLNIRMLVIVLSLVSAMLLTLAQLDPGVFYTSQRQLAMITSGESPKAQAMEVVFTKLVQEYPTTHLVGLGPGQYSSRAGLIASGTYERLSDHFSSIPVLRFGMTVPFKKYVNGPWTYVQNNLEAFGNSTMYRPFFSLLSVYTEFGGLGLLLLLLLLGYQLRLQKEKYRQLKTSGREKALRLLPISCSTAMLFLFFIGFYENYYETVQGIFTGILLILAMRALVADPALPRPKRPLKQAIRQ
ncbi:MAG: hypothetical protein ACO1O1_04295 [Adhaeribacter sp.]